MNRFSLIIVLLSLLCTALPGQVTSEGQKFSGDKGLPTGIRRSGRLISTRRKKQELAEMAKSKLSSLRNSWRSLR